MTTTLDDIKSFRDAIDQAMQEAHPNLAEADPEIWEHLFEDEHDILKEYKPTGTPEEAGLLCDLYLQIKSVVDDALIPSDLSEAYSVFKYQAAEILLTLARKDRAVGTMIISDMKSTYACSEDDVIQKTALNLAKKIERLLDPAAQKNSANSAAATAASIVQGTAQDIRPVKPIQFKIKR